jgi:internalin A
VGLESLSLLHPRITDAGIAHLKELESLTELNLCGADVSGAALTQLHGLKKLRSLGVGKRFGDDDVRYLKGFGRLVALKLDGSAITDTGMIGAMTDLERLSLNSTNVTDVSVSSIARLTRLESLNLDETKITNAGLKEVGKLRGLRSLSVGGREITDEGLAELAFAPGATVAAHRRNGHHRSRLEVA